MSRLATPRALVRLRGAGAIEALLALPILLLVGLGALQFALVYQARHALNHALIEAARAGSVAHADPAAIREGLARGLAPWLYGAADLVEHATAVVRAIVDVAEGEATGRIRIVVQSPTPASFDDWAEPAIDDAGMPIPGLREIPNDSLVHRARRTLPAGGTAGLRAGEPIGAASGQTLADANLLRLNLHYGVPLSVPLVGRFVAWTLRAWSGCAASTPRTLGIVRLPGTGTGPSGPAGACTMLSEDGQGGPLLPVSVSATVRMQSTAREAGASGARAGPAPAGAPDVSPPGTGAARAPDSTEPPAARTPDPAPVRPLLSRPAEPDPAFCRSAEG